MPNDTSGDAAMNRCCFCGKVFSNVLAMHSASPVAQGKKCCVICNYTVVIPQRLGLME